MDAMTALYSRRSIRLYTSKPASKDAVREILTAETKPAGERFDGSRVHENQW